MTSASGEMTADSDGGAEAGVDAEGDPNGSADGEATPSGAEAAGPEQAEMMAPATRASGARRARRDVTWQSSTLVTGGGLSGLIGCGRVPVAASALQGHDTVTS